MFKTILKKHTLLLVGSIGLTIFLIVALFAGFLQPYPEDAQGANHLKSRLLPPSLEHPFGTSVLGRDIFSLVIAGSRLSLISGLITAAGIIVLGVTVGLVAGFAGPWIDEALMRGCDLILSFPPLLLALVITMALGPSLWHAMVAIAIPWWPVYARLTRSEVLRLKEMPFVESARAIGAPKRRIMFLHILPNCFAPILVVLMLDIGLIILTTSSLSFLGLGAQSPTPEWGLLVAKGMDSFLDHWWIATFPGLALFCVAFCFNLVGDGLRELLDPRLRGVSK